MKGSMVPVNPWQITFVFLSISIDIYFIASTIFFAASFKSEADNILRLDWSNISFPSLKFVPANLTTNGTEGLFLSQHQLHLELVHHTSLFLQIYLLKFLLHFYRKELI